MANAELRWEDKRQNINWLDKKPMAIYSTISSFLAETRKLRHTSI
jgi:hypothetical protein